MRKVAGCLPPSVSVSVRLLGDGSLAASCSSDVDDARGRKSETAKVEGSNANETSSLPVGRVAGHGVGAAPATLGENTAVPVSALPVQRCGCGDPLLVKCRMNSFGVILARAAGESVLPPRLPPGVADAARALLARPAALPAKRPASETCCSRPRVVARSGLVARPRPA